MVTVTKRNSGALPSPIVLQVEVRRRIEEIGEVALSRQTGINRAVLLKIALGRDVLIGTTIRAAQAFNVDLNGQPVPPPVGNVDTDGEGVSAP